MTLLNAIHDPANPRQYSAPRLDSTPVLTIHGFDARTTDEEKLTSFALCHESRLQLKQWRTKYDAKILKQQVIRRTLEVCAIASMDREDRLCMAPSQFKLYIVRNTPHLCTPEGDSTATLGSLFRTRDDAVSVLGLDDDRALMSFSIDHAWMDCKVVDARTPGLVESFLILDDDEDVSLLQEVRRNATSRKPNQTLLCS